MSLRNLAVLIAGVALLSGIPRSAAAIEASAAASALAAALTQGSNSSASFDEAKLEGGNILIAGFTLVHGSAADTLRFEETVIESPSEDGNGLFHSPTITFTRGTISGDATGTIGTATLTDVTVLDTAKQTEGGFGGAILFHTAEAADLRLFYESEPEEITVARIQVETANLVDNIPQDSRGVVEDISVPSKILANGLLGPKNIGYDRLVLDVTWDNSRNLEAGTMSIRDLTVSIQDGGDFSINGVIGSLPDPRVLNDADATSKASKVEVHELTIQYDDKSLAGRILDALAKKQGLSRADYAAQISAALPFLLASLNDAEFQDRVAEAIGQFLQDPRSLTIRIEPATPISGEEVLNLAKTAPKSLPGRLNASVTANSPQ